MIITQTPLRLSFFGGNTDFPDFIKKYGGCVLSTAINKYVYCIVTKRFDKKIYINWSKKEIIEDLNEIEHELVREAMKKVGIKNGIEITFLSDIPAEGSGLGSSSSVVVGVLNALYHYINFTPSATQLAKEAVDIELNILGKPIGIQDQYIASFGGLRFFNFNKDGSVESKKLIMDDGQLDDFDNQLMLFYTGMVRKSGDILKEVKTSISSNTELLLKTKDLVEKGYLALEKGDVTALGKLLHKGWLIKRRLSSNISNSGIDKMYEKALEAGAIGGKIAGAGGGGFLLLVVPDNKRKELREALKDFQEMPFRLEMDGSKVIFNIRRY